MLKKLYSEYNWSDFFDFDSAQLLMTGLSLFIIEFMWVYLLKKLDLSTYWIIIGCIVIFIFVMLFLWIVNWSPFPTRVTSGQTKKLTNTTINNSNQSIPESELEIALDESSDWKFIIIGGKKYLKSIIKKHNLEQFIENTLNKTNIKSSFDNDEDLENPKPYLN
jgi:energy-coupling factor transporter transmembrane protein EcfT